MRPDSPEWAALRVHAEETAEKVAWAAAWRILEQSNSAIRERGRYTIALSGGSTPRRAYEMLTDERLKPHVDWPNVHVFFGDERMVPPDHPDSNYRMASEALLSRVPIPPENVHRIEGVGDAGSNASAYESEMRELFGDAEWPRLDHVLLGMGDDGHTASLFPGTAVLERRGCGSRPTGSRSSARGASRSPRRSSTPRATSPSWSPARARPRACAKS